METNKEKSKCCCISYERGVYPCLCQCHNTLEHCDEINCPECQKALLVKTLKDIRKEIESAKNQTQHDTGAFKYDFAYEECLEIINKYENTNNS